MAATMRSLRVTCRHPACVIHAKRVTTTHPRRADGAQGMSAARNGPACAPADRQMRFGAAVYGSFLAASVIGVSYEGGQDARTMTASLFTSMIIFWLAHAWSEVVGTHVRAGASFARRDIPRIARSEWPLVEAAAVPTALLALAWAGVWSRDTGATLALGAALLQITGWGFVAGRREGGTLLSAALLGAVQGMLGVALLALERLVH
jgi:hypothetical protein